jgi:hypothetical protein
VAGGGRGEVQIWGSCLNRSRDFMRQGMTWFDQGDMKLKAQLLRYTVAFPVATKVHLRSDEDMRTELEQVLERTLVLSLPPSPSQRDCWRVAGVRGASGSGGWCRRWPEITGSSAASRDQAAPRCPR